jgi:polyisoprenoid-binding protein YceI
MSRKPSDDDTTKDNAEPTMKNLTLKVIAVIAAGVTGALADNLEIDKTNSRVQVDAKATGHGFTGELKDYTVKVSGNAATNEPTAFSLQWDFNDLKTGDEKRDKEMIKWLGGGKPKGSFTFSKSWTDDKGKLRAEGELTIHGISKTVSFPYSVKRDGDFVTIDGTVNMDYQNFSLPIIRTMAVMTVDPKLAVRFHVVGQVR